jgi:putative phosphoesterase
MRIGLMSDSHGQLANLKDAAWKLVHEWHVSLLVHLGDEWEDAAAVEDMQIEVLRVPGVYCAQYKDPRFGNRIIREFEGQRVLFTHSDRPHDNDRPGDGDPRQLAAERQIAVVAYGHTHIPEARLENGVLWVNPGHLKDEDKQGHPPSFAVLDLEAGAARVLLIDLASGDIFDTCSSDQD